MSWSAIFIKRPVATTLLTLAIALPGAIALKLLPISSLPQMDLPTLLVTANLPGASPETMAATVATPLERSLGTIAGITELTSESNKGVSRVRVQFDIDRDPDAAAREVLSAINAARPMLPSGLRSNPSYRKFNTSGAPIMALALTSDTQTQDQLYDLAFTVIGQRLSQVNGVGQVSVNGSSLRSVRVEANPNTLNQYNISLEQINSALSNANTTAPKGFIQNQDKRWQIDINAPGTNAKDFENLIVSWKNNAPIRLKDVAEIKDSVQDLKNAGSSNGKPAVMLQIYSQPGANVVQAVDAVKALLPKMHTLIPASVTLEPIIDRSLTVRKSLHEVEQTLLIAIGLVILVTFAFLRNARATLIPSIAIPVSLLGTLALIYLFGFSLNNLSLMALIISTGFVVDDAIVVVENTMRHIENGLSPVQAALKGVNEVSFTVIAMSISLVAVFIPLLLMDGMVGKVFREFSVTLAVAVAISLFISLTATPMLCAKFLKLPKQTSDKTATPKILSGLIKLLEAPYHFYQHSLAWVLKHGFLILGLLLVTIATNIYLYTIVPKGFFPLEDTGRIRGSFEGDQSLSFKALREKINRLTRIVAQDPDIESYFEFSSGNNGTLYIKLKPREERSSSAKEVVARLRPLISKEPGLGLRLTPHQDLNIGARPGGAEFQYTLLSNNLEDLRRFTPQLRSALVKNKQLTDVNSDSQELGLQTFLTIDRDAASRLGVTQQAIDATLNDAFGQKLVSTIYEPLNQYYVVLSLASRFSQSPESLSQIYVQTNNNGNIPLSTIARWETKNTPLVVNHEDQFPSSTISFNLAEGTSLDQATEIIESAFAALNPPDTIHGAFSGSAKTFKASLNNQTWLILTALITIYIVLGILYESTIHPLTIISTLPSAGVGAMLALFVFKTELTLIAMIGIILLIGIVIKNAIIMVDAAMQIEREQHISTEQAIYQACLRRFRPILMTTMAAMLGALPLVLGVGEGSEIRRPLGITIVGGLLFSQILTLYSTPVVYLYMDKLRRLLARNSEHQSHSSNSLIEAA